jgi:hypothetical protein
MQFINPIEILGLSEFKDTKSIDSDVIKKRKRKLFADIDLSDNLLFDYHGLQLTKSDCEKVIDELSDDDLKEFYLYLSSNKKLNTFLVNGNIEIFKNFKNDSIFKLNEFIEFISPYFAQKFDKALLYIYENENEVYIKEILSTTFLITQKDLNIAFKSISNNFQNKISDIDNITKSIKTEQSIYKDDNIKDVVKKIKEKFPTQKTNCLPQYFQSQILKTAKSINFLQLSIWDAFDNTQVPNDLLEHLLTLNIGGLDKPIFVKNYEIVRRKNEERKEQEKYAPIIKKYAIGLLSLRKLRDEIENKTKDPAEVLIQIKTIVSIDDLNTSPTVLREIRSQIAKLYRGISISVWNKYSELEVSIEIVEIALSIKVDKEIKEELEEALKQLLELKQKQKSNKKNEIQSLIQFVDNINSQISIHGMINIKADKIKEMLNELFTDNLINSLSESKEIILKRNLFYSLEKTLIKLDAFYSNSFVKRLKPLGNNDGELAISIEKNISGIEFKAKNVLNNVGTGVGKANQTMVENLPSQLVGIIYLVIIIFIVGFISSIFE